MGEGGYGLLPPHQGISMVFEVVECACDLHVAGHDFIVLNRRTRTLKGASFLLSL